MRAQSAFTGGGDDPEMQAVIAESCVISMRVMRNPQAKAQFSSRSSKMQGLTLYTENGAGPSTPPADPNSSTDVPPAPSTASSKLADPSASLLANAGVIEEEDLDPATMQWLADTGLLPEDFDTDYGLLPPQDAVIIRPYGGEDDDILLQELRPRFVVMYEPNLAFIRRLEVCALLLNPILPPRVPRARVQ